MSVRWQDFSSATRGRDLTGRNFIFEAIRIETIESTLSCFRLRVHEESKRRTARSGKSDIVREVVRHPVHFPRPNSRARAFFTISSLSGRLPGGSSSTTFRTSAGSTGTPNRSREDALPLGSVELLLLSPTRHRGSCIPSPTWRHGSRTRRARGKAGPTREANIERIEIGAFAAQIPGLQHEADIADATAARLRISKCIVNDPLVDRPRLFYVCLRVLRDLDRRCVHDTISWYELGRP